MNWDLSTSPNYPILVANDVAGEAATNSVTIECELTRVELTSVVRWHLVHVAHIRRSMVSSLVFAICGLGLSQLGGSGDATFGWIFTGFWLSIFVLSSLLYYRAPRLALEKQRSRRPEADGVHR